MRLAGAAVAEKEQILLSRQELTSSQFQHKRLVERGDSEVETVEALDHWESGLADAALRGSAIAVQQLQLGQAK